VIGEVPAWFLGDFGTGTSPIITELAEYPGARTILSPGGDRTSVALWCSAK
jgi:hypothetical protein